jgi:helix-turn-helix protein/WD40 repeat protein
MRRPVGTGRKVASRIRVPTRADAVSVADLAAAGVRIRPSDAVTIVRLLALQAIRGELPGVPSAHVIRLCASGAVAIEGPVAAAGGRPVQRAAQLLAALLPQSRKAAADAMPLDRIIAGALDAGYASLYPSLQEFADALAPFGAQDPEEAIRALVAIWKEVAVPRATDDGQTGEGGEVPAENELDANDGLAAGVSGNRPSISDMRRARRATGLSLQEVSKRSRIPVSLLRQLEWGYLVNWPVGLYARTQLVRYARAAGLDRQFVLHAVWPLIYEEERVRTAAHEEAVPAASAPQEHTIVILEPSFSANEVLFEAEPASEPARPPDTSVPSVQPVPLPFSASVLVAAPPPDEVEWPRPGAPRRASMVAAAAVLGVAVAGGVWATRTPAGLGEPSSERPSRSVRRVPLHDTLSPAVPAAEPIAASQVHRRPVGTRGASAALAPAIPLVDPSPALAAVDTVDDDESVVYAPVFADAGAAVFSDVAAPGEPAGAPRRQSLRITRVVDENSRNFNAQPSPDGTRVAFDSDRDGERAVFVADADGHHLRRVSGDGPAAVPRWSPDGRSLAYVRAEPNNADVWNLWLLDLNTGESRRLTSYTSGKPRSGSWFADGRRIAYAHGTEVIVLDTSTAEARSYQTPVPGRVVSAPAVSPDGRRIIFQVARDGGWLLELADGSMDRVLSDPSGDQYTWSPDGTQVAYYSRHAGEWNVWLAAMRKP